MASMEETSQDMAEQETTLPSTGNQTLLQENKKKGGRRARPTTGSPWCQLGTLGKNYLGTQDFTVSGKTCQKWSEQSPHGHGQPLRERQNYCRNPDNSPKGVWCYTTDPGTRWEYCDVPKCFNLETTTTATPTTNSTKKTTGCSSGWSPLTTGGNTNCYKVFPDARVSWFQAQHLCHHVGANLASIPTPTINFFILKLVISTKTSSKVYIGGYKPTYRSTNFKWVWWGGAENTGYWNWGPGQPVDELWDNCVSIVPGWGGKWDSLSCNWHEYAYVCEKPAYKP